MDKTIPHNPPSSPPDSAGAQAAESTQAQPKAAQANTGRQTGQQQSARRRRTKRKPSVSALKARLRAKLGHLDHGRLKRILIACGIAAVLVVAIIALIKSIPVGLAILAILGLGVVVRFLEELRHLPVLNTL
jgi:Flp pilus assembly protein TadB